MRVPFYLAELYLCASVYMPARAWALGKTNPRKSSPSFCLSQHPSVSSLGPVFMPGFSPHLDKSMKWGLPFSNEYFFPTYISRKKLRSLTLPWVNGWIYFSFPSTHWATTLSCGLYAEVLLTYCCFNCAWYHEPHFSGSIALALEIQFLPGLPWHLSGTFLSDLKIFFVSGI